MKSLSDLKSKYKEGGAQKYLKNTSWLFLEKILRLFSGLFVGLLVARYLGPEEFGLLNYAMSFAGIFLALSTLGLDSIVVREILKEDQNQNTILGTSFGLKIIGAIVMLFLILVTLSLSENTFEVSLMIVILAFSAIFQSFNVIDFYFQALVKSKFVVYVNIGSLIVSAGIKLVLIYLQAPLIYFAAVFSFDVLFISIGLIYFYTKEKRQVKKWEFDKNFAKSLLSDSWPLIVAGVIVSIYMKIDQIMIKEMLGPAENGSYAAAVRISETWYFIPMAVSSSLFPAIINAKLQNIDLYKKRLQQLYNFMVGMSLLVALPVTFLNEFIIELLFGVDFMGAAPVLMIHIWAGIFVSLGVASGKWLINENLQKYSMYRTVFGAVVNIGLNFLLIPKYGIAGAAFTTLISQMTATWIFDLFFKKTRATFVMKLRAITCIDGFKFIIGK